jgi:choline monooxygenase
MSDLASASQLKPAACQLPVSWYFDPEIFALEKQLLFDAGPNYAGHELMVPEVGDWQTLGWMDHAKMLVRHDNAGIELLTNVCRHRQAIMLQGRGHAENIVCPLHRWTYDLKGELLGAPHFPENPCVKLRSTPLTSWNGLLFTGPRDPRKDIAALSLPLAGDFDFSGYRYENTHVTDYACNWKTFIEVYLEVYHVDPFHPGLGNFTDCSDFRLEYGENWSVQIVGAKNALMKPGSPVYRKWHEACTKYLDGREPKHGALWMTYFPGIMLEWYPHVLVVSHLVPLGPQLTRNVVEFYYPEDIALFEREFIEAEQAAYEETAVEDGDICTRMDRGRRALHDMGLDDAGPYQSPMEDAMIHFHEWVRTGLGR